MKNGIKRMAGLIIFGVILVVLVTSIVDNEDRKLNYYIEDEIIVEDNKKTYIIKKSEVE